MKLYTYEGKNLQELKINALSELNASEEEVFISEEEIAGGFLKSKRYKINLVTKDEILKYAKNFVIDIAKFMGISVTIEAKKREKYIELNLFSENSSILIGKGGRTIDAMQTLIKNSIYNLTGFKVNVIIDVEDYKEKVNKHLENNVIKIAKEVRKSGVDAKLDPMNSYERRIVHNAVNKIKGVMTESIGEEPNRCVVIKKKDEKNIEETE